MIGLLIGTACLVGLFRVLRRGGGWGGPYAAYHGCGAHRGFHGFGRQRGRFGRILLRNAFERLGTTPGQEKVIVAAVSELGEAFSKARADLAATRADFAEVFRGAAVDESSMSDIFVKHDTTLSETRRRVVEALQKIHEALDEKQRAAVADYLESRGPFAGGGWRGRYPDHDPIWA